MIRSFFHRWNGLRLFRLMAGLMVIAASVYEGQIVAGLAGVYLTWTAFANKGCCAGGVCDVPPRGTIKS